LSARSHLSLCLPLSLSLPLSCERSLPVFLSSLSLHRRNPFATEGFRRCRALEGEEEREGGGGAMEASRLKDMIKWCYILYTVAGTGAIRNTQREASTPIPDCELERKKEGNRELERKKTGT